MDVLQDHVKAIADDFMNEIQPISERYIRKLQTMDEYRALNDLCEKVGYDHETYTIAQENKWRFYKILGELLNGRYYNCFHYTWDSQHRMVEQDSNGNYLDGERDEIDWSYIDWTVHQDNK